MVKDYHDSQWVPIIALATKAPVTDDDGMDQKIRASPGCFDSLRSVHVSSNMKEDQDAVIDSICLHSSRFGILERSYHSLNRARKRFRSMTAYQQNVHHFRRC
jgi:hypothetical protein